MGLVPVSTALLALAAGLFLLAKANKDALGALYKIGAWFIIIVSLLVMLCVGTRTMLHFYSGRPMMHEGMMMEERGWHGMGCHNGMMHDGGSCCHKENCCEEKCCGSSCHEEEEADSTKGGK